MNTIKSVCSKIKISEFYYILVVLGYTATLVSLSVRPGVIATVLMLLVGLQLLAGKCIVIRSLSDLMAVCFFAWQVLSVIWLLQGPCPLSVYFPEFTASVLPMIFYFAGKSAGKRAGNWYRGYLIAMLILGILGVIFYVFAPQFYNDWSVALSHTSKADAATTRVRMNSVVGSTCLSFTMVAGMLAAAFFLGEENTGEDSSVKIKQQRFFGAICLALCLLFAILANQRSGLVVAGLVVVYINILIFFKLNLLPKKYFFIELGVLAAVFVLIGILRFDFLLKYWYRLASLPTAVSERSEQWVAAVNNMYSTWLGNGLGANGHHAIGVEDAFVIADGGLIKLYCENGVVGFSMWLFLLILSCKKGLSNLSSRYAELGIVFAMLLQSIGSNMIAFQLCAPIFWFAIGRLNDESLTSPDPYLSSSHV
ncbi:MAG: hypothetical protein K6D90_09390 [Lachnospiraceae bacterium]|nr:hypothetical protein [Lachnospiraceae bacterium]